VVVISQRLLCSLFVLLFVFVLFVFVFRSVLYLGPIHRFQLSFACLLVHFAGHFAPFRDDHFTALVFFSVDDVESCPGFRVPFFSWNLFGSLGLSGLRFWVRS
jgi:hypothetical protein